MMKYLIFLQMFYGTAVMIFISGSNQATGADTTNISTIRKNNDIGLSVIRFGADARSGAPYCFTDQKDLTKIKGHDVEIIHAIAAQLNVPAEYVQNSWEGLIPGLDRGSYDVVADGLVITPEHEEGALFSAPYYISHYQLVVRNADTSIRSLDDCQGKFVGTLAASEAYTYLDRLGGMRLVSYDQEVNGYQDLMLGRIDAFIIDAPVAMYYVPTKIGLKMIDQQIDTIKYGIAVKKGNIKLIEQINEAIFALQRNGKLREILERWNLWNKATADNFGDHRPLITPPTEYNAYIASQGKVLTFGQRMARYFSFLPFLGEAAGMTMVVSVLSMVLAIILGLILAIMRLYGPPPVKYVAVAYIELVRGTPLLIQLLIIFYGLPNIGIKFSPFIAALIGLGLNYAATEAEVYRAGLQAIPRGQTEAAIALGMTRWQALRYVTLPQAFRFVIPPVTNDFIALMKDSSQVSVITMVELTQAYNLLATTYFDHFGIGIQVALMYIIIGLPFVFFARWMERRLHGLLGIKK